MAGDFKLATTAAQSQAKGPQCLERHPPMVILLLVIARGKAVAAAIAVLYELASSYRRSKNRIKGILPTCAAILKLLKVTHCGTALRLMVNAGGVAPNTRCSE